MITYTSSLPSHLMKVQQYTDTHLTTRIMTQYVPLSQIQMAKTKHMIVNRNPIRTGNISLKVQVKYAQVELQNIFIMINTFIFKDELADDWTMDTEYPL